MKKNKRPFFDRRYLGRVAAYAAASIAAIGVLFYIGYHMSTELRGGIDIMYARAETISRTVSGEAYILKDEVMLENPSPTATPAPTVGDGERVRAGDTVAEAYPSATPGALARIAELEEQIDFYERRADDGTTVGDSRAASRTVGDTVIKLRRAAEAGDLSSITSLKSDVILGLREIGILSGRITDINAQLTALRSNLSAARASLGTASAQIPAPSPGYYFSRADGYETVLTSASIDSLTYSTFRDMLDRADAGPADTSRAAGVLMRDFRWYVACLTDSATASSLTEGRHYTVTLGNNTSSPVDMVYYRKLSDATDAVMLFKSSRVPSGFDFTRSQEATVTYAEESGYRIPISAVRMYDGEEGVLILDHTKIDFRRIAVNGEENGYYLCSVDDPTASADGTDGTAETASAETSAETEPAAPKYPYLSENDIIITNGTGLTVGMTYDPKGN